MKTLYYLRWPIILLITGLVIRTTGAMMKVLHWMGGNGFLITGTIVIIVSLLWLAVKLTMMKKPAP